MTLSPSLKTILSEHMAKWYEREMGMWPSEVKIVSESEVLFIRFKNVISPSEISLSSHKAGRTLLMEVNERLCKETFPVVHDIISELTGLILLDIQVEVNIRLHEKIYILTLDRLLTKKIKSSTH